MIIIDGSDSGSSNFTIATDEIECPKGIRLIVDSDVIGNYQHKLDSITLEMVRLLQQKWNHLA